MSNIGITTVETNSGHLPVVFLGIDIYVI